MFEADTMENRRSSLKRNRSRNATGSIELKRRGNGANTSVWQDLFAGGVAGTAGIAVGHPFDTVKVRLQQQRPLTHSQPNPTGSHVQQVATYRGLFRGIGAPLATAALVNASVFCVYGTSSRLWERHFGASMADQGPSARESTIAKHSFCGWVTGVVTSIILCPVEHVKVRLQALQFQGKVSPLSIQSSEKPKSSFSVAKDIITSRHGIRGLYRGLSATVFRQAPSLAIYFPTYHVINESIGKFEKSGTKDHIWWSSAAAGGIAGCVAWATVYPIDVVKSRIQSLPLDSSVRERSFYHVAKTMIRKEGILSTLFSRGLAVTLLRAFPVNGMIFFVYESINEQVNRWESKCSFLQSNDKITFDRKASPFSHSDKELEM